MRLKWLCGLCALAVSVLAGVGSVIATPVTLTVDSSASVLGITPLTGTVAGEFDAGAQSLTFGGGSDVSATGAIVGSTIIPRSSEGSSDASFEIAETTLQISIPTFHLDLTAGSVTDGSDAGLVTFASTGAGTVSGAFSIDFTILGASGSTVLNVTAPVSTPASFQSPLVLGPAGLSDAAGLELTLPFDVPLILGDLEVTGGGALGGALPGVVTALHDALAGRLLLEGLFGVVVAVDEPASAVPEPPTVMLLLIAGVVGGGVLSHARRRRSARAVSR